MILNGKRNFWKNITCRDYLFRPTSITQSAKLRQTDIFNFPNRLMFKSTVNLKLISLMYFNVSNEDQCGNRDLVKL